MATPAAIGAAAARRFFSLPAIKKPQPDFQHADKSLETTGVTPG